MHPPLPEQPITTSAPPEPGRDRKRAYAFCASSFGVVRLEDVREIANLKADLVACYRPVNSQEMFAIERMAIAQQLILRAARLDAGLFTAAMNDVINSDNNPIVTMDPDMIGADIEITRQQNRNFCLAEGFRRIAKESDLMNLALRYRIQAERDYRRALEEFERLERRRPKLPNEPDLLTEPDGKGDIAHPWELNPWIPKPPAKETKPAANEPAAATALPEPVLPTMPAPSSDNIPVASSSRSSRRANKTANKTKIQASQGLRVRKSKPVATGFQSMRVQPKTSSVQPRSISAFAPEFLRAGKTDPTQTSAARQAHRKRSKPVWFSAANPAQSPPVAEHNQPKPPQ